MKDKKGRAEEAKKKMIESKQNKPSGKMNADDIQHMEEEAVNMMIDKNKNDQKSIRGSIVESNKRKRVVFKFLNQK